MRSACLVATLCLLAAASGASAQVIVTGFAPAVVAPAPVVAFRPVTPVVALSPVVSAPPVIAGPQVVAPVAVGATRVLTATPVVTTRFRPILGGTVSRVRYRLAPTTVLTPLF